MPNLKTYTVSFWEYDLYQTEIDAPSAEAAELIAEYLLRQEGPPNADFESVQNQRDDLTVEEVRP